LPSWKSIYHKRHRGLMSILCEYLLGLITVQEHTGQWTFEEFHSEGAFLFFLYCFDL